MPTPDYTRAATLAAETLIRFGINAAPINPIPMIMQMPELVTLVSYTQLSNDIGIKRQELMRTIASAPDAFSSVEIKDGKAHYIIAYNQKLGDNNHSLHCALAREFGHIILGHDGSRPYEVRQEEARCFHHHLLAPRALIHMIQASGIRLTTAALNFMTGCNEQCVSSMRHLPAVDVPAELNRALVKQFFDYFMNHFECQRIRALDDGSALADLGTYMDGYME
jgi:hypothetical protein